MADNFTSTSSISLPKDLSTEIIQKTQEQSAVMQLARQITLPARGETVPVITADPEPEWVNEATDKPVKKGALATKDITPYTLAVIMPFSNQFKEQAESLYNVMVSRLPLALAKAFDATVFGSKTVPGENFDTLKDCTGYEIETDTYTGLVDADADIAEHDGITNGIVLSPKARAILLKAVDKNGRPLFINNVAEGAVPMILGVNTLQSKGAYVATTPATLGFAGDWTQAVYGTVAGMQASVSDQASLTYNDGSKDVTINLWQRNMFAVRYEIEIGFRCDKTVFTRLVNKASA